MPAESKAADSDDAMRVSANNLTIQLFRTVREVFSNNEEEKAPPPILSPSDNRGNIAQKLMEGYKFHGGVCAKCINPLMSYKGKVSCIMCMKAEDTRRSTQGADASESLSYIATALASPNGSDLSAEKRAKDKYVSKEMSQFYERRSNANLTYTAKLLDGYHMHSQICSECDMPMMKYEDSVTCVICPPKVKEVAKSVSVTIVESQKEEQLTTAEITVQRLRGVPPKDEDIERELEKAEIELLKLMKSNSFGETLQSFFTKKKAERGVKNKVTEGFDGRVNKVAEGVATNMPAAVAMVIDKEPLGADEPTKNADWNPMIPPTSSCVPVTTPIVPVTPTFKASINCSLGDSFLSPLKRMFESKFARVAKQGDDRNKAKERIARLIEKGWVVSAESCPKCDLLMFTMAEMQHCVMCGPMPESTFATVDPGFNDLDVNSLLDSSLAFDVTRSNAKEVEVECAKALLNPTTSTHALKTSKEALYSMFRSEPLGLCTRVQSKHWNEPPESLEPPGNDDGKTPKDNAPRVPFADPVLDSENIHYASNVLTPLTTDVTAFRSKMRAPAPYYHSANDYMMRSNYDKMHRAKKAMDALGQN